MASFNRVIMMGNLTKDPDCKQLASGQTVCRLGLASNRQFKNKQTGSMVQEVCFVDIDVWGAQAESCGQYLKKGSAVLVEGRLKFDTWQDNDGQKRSKHSIVADRVTFVNSNVSAQADNEQGDSDLITVEPVQAVTPAKSFTRKSKPKQDQDQVTQTGTGEVNFKDQAPFEDDLPF